MLYLPLLCGVDIDLDMESEFGCCECSRFDGARPRMIVYMDCTTWKFLMLKKDLYPLYLK